MRKLKIQSFDPRMRETTWRSAFWAHVSSLIIIFSGSICFPANFISLHTQIQFHCVFVHILIICSSADEHLGCPHFPAPVNEAAMSTEAPGFQLQNVESLGPMLTCGTTRSHDSSRLAFWRRPQMAIQCTTHHQEIRVPLPHTLAHICCYPFSSGYLI